MFPQNIRFLALAAILFWSSTAAAAPVLEVTASSNPIVGGVVQLNPGDTNVSITFGIVPDAGVEGFNLTFDPTSSSITVVDCAGDVGIALCPGSSSVAFGSGDGFSPALTDPFDVGSATISVAISAAVGDAFETRTGSFIDEGGVTFVGGQVYATVVPEPGTALLIGLGLASLGAVGRRSLEEDKATA